MYTNLCTWLYLLMNDHDCLDLNVIMIYHINLGIESIVTFFTALHTKKITNNFRLSANISKSGLAFNLGVECDRTEERETTPVACLVRRLSKKFVYATTIIIRGVKPNQPLLFGAFIILRTTYGRCKCKGLLIVCL